MRRLGLHIERHPLGPRISFLGIRWHEWHLGAGILCALAAGAAAGRVHDTIPAGLAVLAGVWLVAKDWRDILPRHRDTAAWRLGLHRQPHPLRRFRHGDPLPLLVALAAVAFALVNLLSALTPNVEWRGHLLLRVEAVQELHVFHALAIPASILLLVSAYYLYRRRLRALRLAVGLLVALGLLNLFKGLDFEEAIGDFAVAGVLWLGRGSFYVQHEPLPRRAAAARVPLVLALALVASFLLVAVAAPAGTSFATMARATLDLLFWLAPPIRFHDEVQRLDLAVGLIGLGAVALAAYFLFRPLAAPRDLPDPEVRDAARELVRAHGTDTLAYFKLRRDEHYLFGADGRAFLGYRVESGVLVVSGDPVGPPDAIPGLLAQLGEFAERRGLQLTAVGVSESVRASFEQLGLRALYMGDEAIVDAGEFSLEGRPIRKVRQSVTRLEKAGYRTELLPLGALDEDAVAELEAVSAAWLRGEPERGFSMALDALRADEQADTIVLVARDAEGVVRGFLHFVPSYGREAVSLAAMRRDPSTPNGLTEFMIVRAIEPLRERGIVSVSLNFAAFARLLHSPRGPLQRLLGRALSWADAFFQIERLYRFNAKFFPRWEARYVMYEGPLRLPRAALAILWLEGQLPKPKLPPRRRARPV